jgi:hypothetical protein
VNSLERINLGGKELVSGQWLVISEQWSVNSDSVQRTSGQRSSDGSECWFLIVFIVPKTEQLTGNVWKIFFSFK